MGTAKAVDLRSGMVVLGEDGIMHRVENRELCPPTPVRLMVALTLRSLDTGTVFRLVRPADEPVEVAALLEREVECLYLTDSGCVLFDPASCEQYDAATWTALGLVGGLRPGQRLVARFWRGRPVMLTPPPV
jgi:translation elongation factor P/translation initiation factor 5A